MMAQAGSCRAEPFPFRIPIGINNCYFVFRACLNNVGTQSLKLIFFQAQFNRGILADWPVNVVPQIKHSPVDQRLDESRR